jgi:hypothetical protein
MLDQVGDLGRGIRGDVIRGLDQQGGLLGMQTQAEGGEGDAERGGFGSAPEGEHHQPFTLRPRLIKRLDPIAQRVPRQLPAIQHFVEAGKTFWGIGKGRVGGRRVR